MHWRGSEAKDRLLKGKRRLNIFSVNSLTGLVARAFASRRVLYVALATT